MAPNVPLPPRTLSSVSRMMVAATMRRARQIITGAATSGPDAASTASMYLVFDGVEVHVTVTIRGPECDIDIPGLPRRR